MDDLRLGSKILEYRQQKKLNNRQLAEMANITPSMLSQIERGLATPSIHVLRVIAKVLDIPLFHLFIDDTVNEQCIVRAGNQKRMVLPQNEALSYELLTPDLRGTIEFAKMTLEPGAFSTEEPIGHIGEEVAYVMEGKTDLWMQKEQFVLEEGDSVRIPPNTEHKWENNYPEKATVIFAITPPSF